VWYLATATTFKTLLIKNQYTIKAKWTRKMKAEEPITYAESEI
jgi:hypothetical protein